MDAADIRPGIRLLVPVGADQTRTHTYALQVTTVDRPASEATGGKVLLTGEVLRLDGTPSQRRKHRRGPHNQQAPYTRFAILRPDRVERIEWCPSCTHRLDWVEDQWQCPSCGDEWHDETLLAGRGTGESHG